MLPEPILDPESLLRSREITRLRIAILMDGRRSKVIAEAAGFPASRLSEYTMGKRSIPTHHLIALSEVLAKNPQDLVGYVSP